VDNTTSDVGNHPKGSFTQKWECFISIEVEMLDFKDSLMDSAEETATLESRSVEG